MNIYSSSCYLERGVFTALCHSEALRSNPGFFEKKYRNSEYSPYRAQVPNILDRHRTFFGRKSFAETPNKYRDLRISLEGLEIPKMTKSGKESKKFAILVMFLPLALPKPRAKEGETYTGIPTPHESRPWDVFMYCIQRS